MRRRGKLLLTVLLLVLLLAGCGKQAAEQDTSPDLAATAVPTESPTGVQLWLAATSPLGEALERLCGQYNRESGLPPVELHVFDTEEELEEALRQERPALLLCDGLTAQQLAGERPSGERSGTEKELLPAWGKLQTENYMPLGAEIPLLVLRGEELKAPFESLEALCEAAAAAAEEWGEARFAADSLAQLFAGAMAQRGEAFSARIETDRENESFREIYNLLANCVFDGGLALPEEAVLPLLLRDELSAGICSSTDVGKEDADGLTIVPVPPMAGTEALTFARIWGLAVQGGEFEQTSADFIRWLNEEDRMTDAVREAGLLPARAGSWMDRNDPLTLGLKAAANEYRLLELRPEDGFAQRADEFEAGFRAALAMLS